MQIEHSHLLSRNYQKIIGQQKRQIEQLNYNNQNLKNQLSKVISERDNYNYMLCNDPLQIIFQQNKQIFNSLTHSPQSLDYQQKIRAKSLEERIQIYREKIIQLEQDGIISKSINLKYQTRILNLQQEKKVLKLKSLDLQRQLSTTKISFNAKQQAYRKMLQIVHKSQQKLQQQRQINYQLETQKMEIQIKNTNKFIHFTEQIQFLGQKWNQYATLVRKQHSQNNQNQIMGAFEQKYKDISKKFKCQQRVVEELGRQLQERNQELSKCISIDNGEPGTEKDFKKYIMQNILDQKIKKQKLFLELTEKLKQIIGNYQKSLNQKEAMQKSYQMLKKQFTDLEQSMDKTLFYKNQFEKYKDLFQQGQSQLNQLLKTQFQILRENQTFYHFMYSEYGNQDFTQRVNKLRKNYEQNVKRRCLDADNSVEFFYVNIEQLYNMNRKLMNMLRSRKQIK